jgi:hypothetical protein
VSRRFFLPAVACVAVALAAATAAPPDAKDFRFKVAIKARTTMGADGQAQKVDGDTAFTYTWKRDGNVRTLVVESAEVRVVAGGQDVMNAKMSRAGFTEMKGGKATEVKIEDAPEQLKKMLTDSFGTPICKIEVDAAGKEVKRTVVAGAGAAALIDSGMIANATMFHPWYRGDRDEWQADLQVSTGNGLVTGKVTYTKIPGGKGGQAVKVAGTITADGIKLTGGVTVNNGKYTIKGEQTYDPVPGEWVAGNMTMDLDFKLTAGTKVIPAKGEMAVTFELLPEKK